MRDDILDFIGYEYITSHVGRINRKKEIFVPSYESDTLKGYNEAYLTDLENLCRHAIEVDIKLSEAVKRELTTALNEASDQFKTDHPEFKSILSQVIFMRNNEMTICYFMKSKTTKQAIGIMKQNKLSDGTVYPDRQFKYDSVLKSGIVNVIQIGMKHYMVVFEIHLVK